MMKECYASDGKDHIFLMGGRRYSIENGWEDTFTLWTVNYFQIYEVSTDSWKKGPSLKWGGDGLACEVSSVTQRIYTFGGDWYGLKIESIGLDLSIFTNKMPRKNGYIFFLSHFSFAQFLCFVL